MLDLRAAYQQTYSFVCSDVLPFLAWPELETAVSYWVEQHQISPNKIYNDIFPLLSNSALGGSIEQATPLAAFWLLNIIAARVFDDIQDDEGAHRPWNAAGLAQALPIGIALLNIADICLTHLQVSRETFRELITRLKRIAALAARAQRYPPTKTTTLAQYLENSLALTGEIIAIGAWAGARLQTSDPKMLQAFYQYGQSIGMKMAILSDCHDLSPQEVGKRSDLTVSTYKLPVIYAVSITEHVLQAELKALLQTEDPLTGSRLQKVIHLLEEIGSIAWCNQLAEYFQQLANTSLKELPNDVQKRLHTYS